MCLIVHNNGFVEVLVASCEEQNDNAETGQVVTARQTEIKAESGVCTALTRAQACTPCLVVDHASRSSCTVTTTTVL